MRPSQTEITEKERRVRELLEGQGLDALLISRQANFAWLTCGGDNHVVIASEIGSASLLITRDARWLVCDNIEAGRVMSEELADLGYQQSSYQWYEGNLPQAVGKLVKGKLGADTPIPNAEVVESDLAKLRYSLLPEEVQRYRWLGARCGEVMRQAAGAVAPGMTEHEMAALIGNGLLRLGIMPTVLLVAADERAFQYRHPIPTDRKLDRHVMLILCGRRWGLIVSLTRMVCFGTLSPELRRKHQAVTQVDATFIAHTRPGAKVKKIFQQAVEAYQAHGYGDEWTLHHQGGATGYAGRDYKATASSKEVVQPNQAFAWNPSITGTKSEDTIIALPDRPEIISHSPDWPMLDVTVGDQTFARPDILLR